MKERLISILGEVALTEGVSNKNYARLEFAINDVIGELEEMELMKSQSRVDDVRDELVRIGEKYETI